MFSEVSLKTFFLPRISAFCCKKKENKVLYRVDYDEYFYPSAKNKFENRF